jgi:uroporphyrin-III C-methyltransferase
MAKLSRDREAGLVVLDGGARQGVGAGRVWLVGAGPGDPELLTVKAVRVLQETEVVVHDRLVPPAILALANPAARRLYVGKRKSHHSVPQDELNGLLIALARQGLRVVRLKGGDPFMFGRGGEELLACRTAGVPCDVVPGITAAAAAAAITGAPLTHRGLAQAVTFVTGHAAADGEPDLDWAALARLNQTVAVYMGLTAAPRIAARLLEHGRSPSTPVLLVERASQPEERRVLTTLGELPQAAAALNGPAVLVMGEVAALAELTPLEPAHGLEARA